MSFTSLDQVHDDYALLEADDRYRLLIDIGRSLEPMPDALKTDATLVRGCSAAVWLYPVAAGGRPPPLPRRFERGDHQGHRRPDPARRAGPRAGGDPRARHRRRARPLRPVQPAQLEPHPGHSQHDRADPRERRAAGGMSADPRDRHALRSRALHDLRPRRRPWRRASASPITPMATIGPNSACPMTKRLIGMAETGIIASGPDHQPDGHGDQPRHLDPARHVPPPGDARPRVDYLRPATPGAHDHRPRHLLRH